DLAGEWGSRMAALANGITRLPLARRLMESILGVDRRRKLPPFAAEPLEVSATSVPELKTKPISRAVLFADQFPNLGSPQRGLAALRVLREAGVDVVLSDSQADGRAPLSQGMVATAATQASDASRLLAAYIDGGREVVVVEPSVLA